MIAQQTEIRTSDGISDGFIYSPRESSRVPGIIFLTDIAGIRPSQCEMAQRLAGEGYTVLLPNISTIHRRSDQPALAAAAHQGSALLRSCRTGPDNASRGDRELESRAPGLGRPVRKRSVRGRLSRLDSSRQSGIQPSPGRARFRKN